MTAEISRRYAVLMSLAFDRTNSGGGRPLPAYFARQSGFLCGALAELRRHGRLPAAFKELR